MTHDLTIYQGTLILSIDQAIVAWLDEKHGRSESHKTKHAYESTLTSFRSMLQGAGFDMDSEPALIAPLAQGWAGHSAREGQTVTHRRSISASPLSAASTSMPSVTMSSPTTQ